uniref:PD-(D/E)XK nuclease family protein n=1 Tax=Thermodesulfobacterium geofontis TaxID=1295609 RepID=A0A7V4JR90_9BACT
MNPALLIPPSSHFLKTLTNFFFNKHSLDNIKTLKVWCIFPTKRSGLYFKNYLKEKLKFKKIEAGFFPRIFSFEEFIETLYTDLISSPLPQIPPILRIFVFLEVLEKRLKFFSEKKGDNFEKYFNWGLKFLEVFEEFEKEGKVPENLLYPPEGLPELAKKLFEELKTTYLEFSSLIEEKGFSYYSYRLKKVNDILKEEKVFNTIFNEIDEIWFIGFAALRRVELEIFKYFKEKLKSYFIFEAYEPIPSVIKDTLKALELDYKWISPDYYEKREFKDPQIYFYETTDPHLEVKSALELIPESLENPDEVAIVVPNPFNLLPLIYALEGKENPIEVNITLQYPITKIPLNQFLQNLIKVQKEREEKFYPTPVYLKILKHPYFLALELEEAISFQKIVNEIENELRKIGYLKITLDEIEDLVPKYRDYLEKIHKLFFKNWEDIKTPFELSENLKNILNFFEPLFEKLKEENSWHSILLRNYIHVLETKIFPIFEEETYFKDKNFSGGFLLEILEYLLKEEKIPFIGDPLKGLQIMGFLETRLLSFKKIIILDVNEGFLPPAPSFNPLLTDEIKIYLGIPIFRNELWVYYFERLIKSAEEVHLFYIFVEKSKTQDFREPSRFIQKLKWELEKEEKKPIEKLIPLYFEILPEKEGIPKTQKDKESLLNLIKTTEISRYFLETYLRCGVKFYFRYLLKLREETKIGLRSFDICNFIHEFFENIFKELEGKEVLMENIYKEGEILEKLENLWLSYKFERKMDALSHFLSKKIAIETIKRYFNYLIDMERSGKVKGTKILGVERSLRLFTECNLFDPFYEDFKNSKVLFSGRTDFLIKRREGITKYLILDFKSNPDISPYPKKKDDVFSFTLPDKFDNLSLYEVADIFGSDLSGFQPRFYYYLFYQQKEKFITENDKEFVIINAGFITPSNFKKPEKFVFNLSSRGDWAKVYDYFKNKFKDLLEWILNHIIISDKFYLPADDKVCKYCEYKAPCKNYRYLLD